jgi:hypothetical protein
MPKIKRCPPALDAEDEVEVMREQFDALLYHARHASPRCKCSDCERFALVKAALFHIFQREGAWPYASVARAGAAGV